MVIITIRCVVGAALSLFILIIQHWSILYEVSYCNVARSDLGWPISTDCLLILFNMCACRQNFDDVAVQYSASRCCFTNAFTVKVQWSILIVIYLLIHTIGSLHD